MDAFRIRTDPDPFEPFRIAQGYRVGDLIFLSGQAALDATGAIVGAGDLDAQAEATFRAIERVLAAAGSSLAGVVKVTIYLTDMAYFPRIVELRGRWFTPPWPADTIVEVARLALPELMLEIDVIALAGGTRRDAASEVA
ncbi:MAG: RidA family protein [Sphingomonadaceae bacterium]